MPAQLANFCLGGDNHLHSASKGRRWLSRWQIEENLFTASNSVCHRNTQNSKPKPAKRSAQNSLDKINLDIFWLKDGSLEDTDNLPAPSILAAKIAEQLEAALEEFSNVEEVLADAK